MARSYPHFNMPDAAKIDALGELMNELLTELTHSGRITDAEARVWDGQSAAIILDRPELATPAGIVVSEAEGITFAASRG